jgi:hypothetical protein
MRLPAAVRLASLLVVVALGLEASGQGKDKTIAWRRAFDGGRTDRHE